jgi:hypothetical protein
MGLPDTLKLHGYGCFERLFALGFEQKFEQRE